MTTQQFALCDCPSTGELCFAFALTPKLIADAALTLNLRPVVGDYWPAERFQELVDTALLIHRNRLEKNQ